MHGYLWTRLVSKDVTPTQFSAITVIAASPGTDQVALSRESGLDTSTTGAVIHRLIQRGWVEPHRDPRDRRRKLLRLTEQGTRVHAEIAVAAAAMTETLVGGLSEEDRSTLVRLLDVLVAHGEALRDGEDG